MTDYTAGGLIEPIDWTRPSTTRPPRTTRPTTTPARSARPSSRSSDGEFETVGDAGRRRGSAGPTPAPDWAEPEPTNFELSRGAPATMIAGRVDRRGPLPGGPPGHAARARSTRSSRSGFVLTYKTSGVFNLAFGAQAYVSAAMYFKARTEWGWAIVPALVVSVVRARARCSGCVLERLDLPPPPHGVGGGQARRRHRPVGRAARPVRPRRRLRGRSPAGRPRASSPTAPRVFYDPFGVYAFSRNELVAMGVAVVGDGRPRRAVPVHRHRPADAGGRREPADDRAQRHPRRPGVGLRLGAVVPLRRPGRRADRPPVQHAGGARLLQPRRRRHRRRRRRPAGQPAAGAASAASASASSSRCSTRSCPGGATTARGCEPIQDNLTPAHPVRRAVRRARARGRRSGGPARPPTRWPGVDPPPPSLAAASRSAGASPAPRGSSASCSSASSGSSCFTRADAVVAVPRHPGRDPGDDLPVDHRDHRHRRPDLALPGHLRRHRRLHRVPARRPLRHVGAGRARSSARRSPRSSARCCRCRSGASAASGWPSPRWPSPSSSTPSW